MARGAGRPRLTPEEIDERDRLITRALWWLPLQLGSAPTMAEIARFVGVSERTARRLMRTHDELRRQRFVAMGLNAPGELVDEREMLGGWLGVEQGRRDDLMRRAFWGDLTPGQVAEQLGIADDRGIRRELERMRAAADPEVRAEIDRRRRHRN